MPKNNPQNRSFPHIPTNFVGFAKPIGARYRATFPTNPQNPLNKRIYIIITIFFYYFITFPLWVCGFVGNSLKALTRAGLGCGNLLWEL